MAIQSMLKPGDSIKVSKSFGMVGSSAVNRSKPLIIIAANNNDPILAKEVAINKPLVQMINVVASIDSILKQRFKNAKIIERNNSLNAREAQIETEEPEVEVIKPDAEKVSSGGAGLLAGGGLAGLLMLPPVQDAIKEIVDGVVGVGTFVTDIARSINGAFNFLFSGTVPSEAAPTNAQPTSQPTTNPGTSSPQATPTPPAPELDNQSATPQQQTRPSIMSSIMRGATTGGAIVPVIGHIVGGVAGGISGAFNSSSGGTITSSPTNNSTVAPAPQAAPVTSSNTSTPQAAPVAPAGGAANNTDARPANSTAGMIDLTHLTRGRFNFGQLSARRGFIIHHTGPGLRTAEDVINVFKDRNFPTQYIIDRQGRIFRALPAGRRGQHMKNGTGIGSGLNNSNTEGVEIMAEDDRDVLPVQVEAAQRLYRMLGYSPSQVYGHGEVQGDKQRTEGSTVVNAIRGGVVPSQLDIGVVGSGTMDQLDSTMSTVANVATMSLEVIGKIFGLLGSTIIRPGIPRTDLGAAIANAAIETNAAVATTRTPTPTPPASRASAPSTPNINRGSSGPTQNVATTADRNSVYYYLRRFGYQELSRPENVLNMGSPT